MQPSAQMQSIKANTDNFNYIDTFVEYIGGYFKI
jgi:hypothetical protein